MHLVKQNVSEFSYIYVFGVQFFIFDGLYIKGTIIGLNNELSKTTNLH